MPNVKLSPALAQRLFDSFPLKSESLQVKLVNDKRIPFEMSYHEYIEIFNRLINVGKIFRPIGVSPKSFNNSYMFKKGCTLRIMSFLELNRCNKSSRVVRLDYKCKDWRSNPLLRGEVEAEQTTKIKISFKLKPWSK